ncbi:MAG: tRNA pseudouridine(55) synthase TruB [Candidatus Binatia bacterium]
MNALLLIDKPDGLTSAEVVRRVKRRLTVKVGHLGTLDPFATGLLPLCLGEATKIAQFLNTADKRYEGVIRLGWSTNTGDRTGERLRQAPVPSLAAAALAAVAAGLTGEHLQQPPMYSAIKRDGVPLYRLARRGVEVEREARPVRIASLQLEAIADDRLRCVVACSKGTYIRVLAEDIGRALGTEAHLDSLRRTGFGRFSIEQAVPLDGWEPDRGAGLVGLREALADVPTVVLDGEAVAAVRQGKAWVLGRIGPQTDNTVLLVEATGELAAVAVRAGDAWAYARVLVAPSPLLDSSTVVIRTAK